MNNDNTRGSRTWEWTDNYPPEWLKHNPYETKEAFTREEVKALMGIACNDFSKKLGEIIEEVKRGKEIFLEYDKQKSVEIANLRAEVDQKDKEIEGLIEIHHAQDDDLKERFESLESENKSLRSENQRLKEEIEEWKCLGLEAADEISRLKKEIEGLKDQLLEEGERE